MRNRFSTGITGGLLVAAAVLQSIPASGGVVAGARGPKRQAQAANQNPGVLPVGSHPFGKSYAQWSERWWQWTFSLPADQNTEFQTGPVDCSAGQSGEVWFIGGTFGPATVTRSCTIPSGKALFFPIVNIECSVAEGNGTNEAELREFCVQNPILRVSASIDGRELAGLNRYYVVSGPFTWGPLPDNNVFQALGFPLPAGTTTSAVNDGVYLMLHPLPPGPHTIRFSGEMDTSPIGGGIFTQDITSCT